MRNAVVVAFEGEDEVSFGPHDCDSRGSLLQGQSAVIFQKNDGFFGSLEGNRAIRGGIVGAERQVVQRIGALRVEESELKAGCVEALRGLRDQAFRDQLL